MKSLWRIAAETRSYRADDLSGAGAANDPGRWNLSGDAVVYTSPTLSLAALETAANLDATDWPLNRFVVKIRVPASVWAERKVLMAGKLPPAWRAIPAGLASAAVGSSWVRRSESALLLVPSVIIEEEMNVLINASHADAGQITAKVIRRFEYNNLFRR